MATRELAVLTVCLALVLVYLAVEKAGLERALRRVPRRVAVTGTRGKSGVARLVAAGLRASGATVLAKTTGSKPALILPDGSEREVARPGPASVREQVRLVRLAARLGADTLVAEMMSIGPEYLEAESRLILRPGALAVTNVRLDHTDEMGGTRDEIAGALARAFPPRGTVFVPEEELRPAFGAAAARTGAALRPVGRGEGTGAAPLSFGEFEPNLRLARAVLSHLGVGEEAIRQGLSGAAPDFGRLRLWRGRFGRDGRPAVCVSAFAANEPESSAAALAQVRERLPAAERPLVGLLCLREDRGARTLQWVRAAGEGFFRGFAAVVLVGPSSRAALRRLRGTPGPPPPSFSRFDGRDPGDLMDRVLAEVPEEPVVVGLGNIVGWGERIVLHWAAKGTPHDP
ncbi:MAG TPA: poly-gamma-glutamate synthase PgsB [Candidatus Aminicenantes bacterium]|nr:poly-gamma-glutamate synthase PgsB [Candidatus Aminicenantes bacterium]